MEFTLFYSGRLKSGNSANATDKHRIRRIIQPQLSELLKLHPGMSNVRGVEAYRRKGSRTLGAFQFLPIVSDYFKLVCALDVLLLRRGWVGNIVTKGDIDNRLKTLFDALRVPDEQQLPKGDVPGEGEVPFLCLLEDDARITDLRVRADTLLTPFTPPPRPADTMVPVDPTPTEASPLQPQLSGNENEREDDVRLFVKVTTIPFGDSNVIR